MTVCLGSNFKQTIHHSPTLLLYFFCGFVHHAIVPSAQILLFADPKPLVEHLGREFFRQIPQYPGVYLMRDASEVVLYVGKAKNLRKRLASYRVANPDRMPRRHLRLLRSVHRIDFEQCASESAALARESELLRALKPRFNRAGTYTSPLQWFNWRVSDEGLELSLTPSPEPGFHTHQFPKGGAKHIYKSLVRLLWYVLNPTHGPAALPPGWFRGRMAKNVCLASANPKINSLTQCVDPLQALFQGDSSPYAQWTMSHWKTECPAFELELRNEDLERVIRYFAKKVTGILDQ